MFVTVTERWNYDHTDQQRIDLHNKLDQMKSEGKFILAPSGDRSVYNSNGSPTKTFTNIDAAKEYIAFYDLWQPPVSMTINSFDNNIDYLAYLESVTDLNFIGEPGPQH